MSTKKERNYWPHAILGIILVVVIAGGYTVNMALEHPVQESTYFMVNYQDVEENVIELEKQKDAFDENFDISYSIKKFRIGKNKLNLKITNKTTGKLVNDADIDMLLTRPNTNDFNLKLKPIKVENGTYIFNDLDIKNLGRWKVLTKINIDKYKGFNSYDINATRK